MEENEHKPTETHTQHILAPISFLAETYSQDAPEPKNQTENEGINTKENGTPE